MSGYAYQWAKQQRVGDSSTKTLLKTYAHWASEDYTTWVTNDELMADTEMDIKTIRKCRDKLIALGFLAETSRRVGETRSIVVYQMLAPEGSVVVQSMDQRTGERISLSPPSHAEFEEKNQKRSPSKSGGAKRDQKRSLSENGAAPKTDSSPSTSGSKPLQISPEAPPNLDPNKAVEEQEKTGEKQNPRRAPRVSLHSELQSTELPEWLDRDAWAMWCEHREAKDKDAPWTRAAAKVSIARLTKLRDQGADPTGCIEEAVLRGWTGLWAPKQGDTAVGGASVPDDWHTTAPGITERGKHLGVVQQTNEPFERFKVRVFKAAGPGVWIEDLLTRTSRESDERYAALYAYFNDIPRDRAGDGSVS
ncbi:hypothetical protein PQH03_06885 [Ralstonia insidiosa]|uniref:hypothetical protein n=1 Tax=Ralstonia insidiosa TaxID=190721 RepID=UPI00204A9397|nr:hypothetical protein [Ralstonia insidiosa]MDE4924350.1 hypothetical protein [Ralstonia insidiosa]UNJ99893.1 hypothetical protein MMB19_14320 [Ralstonia insidiosa]